jgi:hypothetical protein
MNIRLFLAIVVLVAAAAIWGMQAYSPAQRGERAFAQLGCIGFHFSGSGPNLTHVVKKHDDALLVRFISDPELNEQ